MTTIPEFLTEITRIHAGGKATEHSYRPALQSLFNALNPDIIATNEPKREKFGAPDFIFERKGVTIAHVEAKDIPIGLRAMKDSNKEQQDRYRKGFANLIYTNGLDWDFYRKGELVASVKIADYIMGIQPIPANFDELTRLLHDTIAQKPQTITSPKDLAERMAGKAGLIKDVLFKILDNDPSLTSTLATQFTAFRDQLIHDITPADFADIYAETIAYGMFAARLHDPTPDTFSRSEALDLLPKSNPFLRSLFSFIAGPDLDDNMRWIIDDLAAVFQAADVHSLMQGFGKLTGQNDPFLHFYETFLAAYNPAKRKARGVWYTPEPVVNFIVRAVDDVLKTEFNLPDGLADTSKVTLDWETGQTDKSGKRETIRKEVHRVQILDPATGTGTFLAEVIKQIAPKIQGIAPGMWSSYIERDLIPRLHGFELLMASYAMCHMKLDMILTELGYQPTGTPPRLGVYLTNSLEEGQPANQSLPFAQWLSNEVREANTVKRDMPIMCVIGNPPYSGISQNMGSWITGLIEDYKYVDGIHFGERKHSLHDDYVKFTRMAEDTIRRNGEGILGFVTNHGYLDNPTFRGMRWNLQNTFDKIFILDLHGNSKRGENPPKGVIDKNVFDIQQGVSVIVAIKKKSKKPKKLARVFCGELWGSREHKYSQLFELDLQDASVKEVQPVAPYFYLNDRIGSNDEYVGGFSIFEFMQEKTTGVQTSRDQIALGTSFEEISAKIVEFTNKNIPSSVLRDRYFTQTSKKYQKGDTRDWKLNERRFEATSDEISAAIVPYAFRPFDNRFIALHGALVSWPRMEVSAHMLKENFSLITARSNKTGVNHFLCSRHVSDVKCGEATTGSIFAPLYLYPSEQDLDQTRRVNFDTKLFAALKTKATDAAHPEPDEVQVFDYIYGTLHCPAYRATYAEFLKIDFPRIPWPASPTEFWDVSAKGQSLRKLHLMDAAAIGATPYPYLGDGPNTVEKPEYRDGKVWINPTQYFDAAPEISWGFYIGGYQPAQKWLKDRRGRALGIDDIRHYQRILKILSETDRIMQTITMTLSA